MLKREYSFSSKKALKAYSASVVYFQFTMLLNGAFVLYN